MKRIIFSLLMMALPFAFVAAQNVATGPVISFEKLTHDFGSISKGTPISYDFVFTNTGKQPLLLSEPRSSCGCTVPSYPKEPIMPGQKKSIKITFDAEKEGDFSKQVNILSNAENSPVVIVIKGKVI
ncbi:MAG: hypothetical protein A2W93_15310 [Bacteroidetes bacterium GWF2_43_63]|nr:MAG: hypothetical protein A2W94_05080 [Bacteroidetes bacterium GWE2_42_42]OFY53389.1 MAG: hypothetical protein A2W93_15310 [Bacteroidetes bacterium GWF2_43_63]HBG69440.1 DUF1573 domain-containing protein [Bacteroidales bacterium]HCB62059.1 DUF1573 domain-containing protein [Bacteroidales bacterium]HCY23105.1 DUF1573 domain-containing protein [Bacteroidales bacterium]